MNLEYGKQIAKICLDIGAIKLRPDDPFLWASGFKMPIYNDNRMLLGDSRDRMFVAEGFKDIITSEAIPYDIIAGTSTAGISPATTLADLLRCPMIYVRDKPKDHGLKNQIEGIDAESTLNNRRVLLIEDLISTGGSSVRAIEAIREAEGVINTCLSIFNYGLDKAVERFQNAKGGACNVISLLTYDVLLEVAKDTGHINDKQIKLLEEWRTDPFGWGEKHGFPKVER